MKAVIYILLTVASVLLLMKLGINLFLAVAVVVLIWAWLIKEGDLEY